MSEQETVTTDAPEDKVQVVEIKENPLLKKIRLPGQKYRLPSKGLFYKNGELDEEVVDGEVEVYPMTTIDEINLKTPDLIFQGTAIERVFERCIPQIKKPGQLLSKDVDYLLACLRRVSYGSTYTIKWKCDCENAKSHEYEIPLDHLIHKQTTEISSENLEEEFTVELSNSQIVKLKPWTFSDFVNIAQYEFTELDGLIKSVEDNKEILADKKLQTQVEEYMLAYMTNVIESVDGITDKEMINEWAKQLPVNFKSEISAKYTVLSEWGTDFTYSITCKDCEETTKEVTAALNPVGFFSQPSNPTEAE